MTPCWLIDLIQLCEEGMKCRTNVANTLFSPENACGSREGTKDVKGTGSEKLKGEGKRSETTDQPVRE